MTSRSVGPVDGDVQQPGLLGPGGGGRWPSGGGRARSRRRSRRRSCHSRPLAAWNVSSSTPRRRRASANGLVAAIQVRSAAPSPSGWSRRNSSTAAATRRSATSIASAGSPARRRARRGPSRAVGVADGRAVAARTASASGLTRRERVAAHRDAGGGERPAEPGQLGVRAGEHGDLAPARTSPGSSDRDERGDQRGLVVLVVGGDDPHRRRRRRGPTTPRASWPPARSTCAAGGDDLRRAAVVRRQRG